MARKQTQTVAFVLPTDQLVAFGKDMANVAHDQTVQSGNFWSRALTHYLPAQSAGMATEAVAAMFKAGKGNGVKAPWYRSYKSILGNAAKYGVKLPDGIGASDAQSRVKDAKDAAIEAATPGKAQETRITMFTRAWVSLRTDGVSEADLLRECQKALKAAQAKDAKPVPAAVKLPVPAARKLNKGKASNGATAH